MSAHAGTSSFSRALESSLRQRGLLAESALRHGGTMVATSRTVFAVAEQAPAAPAAPRWQWSQTVVGGFCMRLWARWQARQGAVQRAKRLRLVETVNLGEKRFAAILEVQGRQFLVGGGTAGVSLLAQLDEAAQPEAPPKRKRRSSKSAEASAASLVPPAGVDARLERVAQSKEQW